MTLHSAIDPSLPCLPDTRYGPRIVRLRFRGSRLKTRAAALVPALALLLLPALSAQTVQEQEIPAAAMEQSLRSPIPNLVRFQGSLPSRAGEQVAVRFSVFAEQSGGSPLWQERQLVQTDSKGQFTVLLGAGSAIGMPQALFAAGEPRWLGVQAEKGAESRTLLASVPYAMKAADADTLAGQPAARFVTQEELAAKLSATATALTAQAAQPLLAGMVSGTGTANVLPLWTSASVLGNSALFQTGSGATAKVGIAANAPATTLDVHGASTLRGTVSLPAAAATAAAGGNSPALQFSASSFKSGGSAIAQNFQWQAQPTGNNTASPSAKLALLFGASAAPPKATGLSIAPNGVITFAPGQSFPSTATLFPKGATFDAESYMTGSSTDWMLVATNTGAGKGTILGQASGTSTGIEGASPGGIGVEGASDAGYGVYGIANTTGTAIYGATYGTGPAGKFWSQNASGPAVVVNNIAGGTAISSTATNGYGGYFSNNSVTQAAVYATNAGDGNAGYFTNNGPSHVALAGVNSSLDQNAVGVYGNVDSGEAVYGISANGYGVYGNSSYGYAVYGTSDSAFGVYGNSPSNYAVYGNSVSGTGVYGTSSTVAIQGTTTVGTAVYAESTNSGVGLRGLTQDNNAGQFVNSSDTNPTILATNYGTGGMVNAYPVFSAVGKGGSCRVGGDGDLGCTGRVKALVDVGGARKVETYSVQSPESWLEDFGSETLKKGVAVVKIDPGFAETVSETSDYHVFITPNGDSKGLYVIRKAAASFEVRESGGGTSSVAFDYRIVAKRRGFELERLTDVTEQFRSEAEAVRKAEAPKTIKMKNKPTPAPTHN